MNGDGVAETSNSKGSRGYYPVSQSMEKDGAPVYRSELDNQNQVHELDPYPHHGQRGVSELPG